MLPAVADDLRPLRRACLAGGAAGLVLLALTLFAPPFARWDHASTGMLTVHLLLELVALSVALLIVNIGWHALDRDAAGPHNVLIGGFTVVASCDLVHALTYAGMPPLLGPASTERAIFYWLAGRSAEVLTLAWLALGGRRPLTRGVSLAGGLLASATLVGIGAGGLDEFPRTFQPGQGVTGFKVAYEWGLCLANLVVAALLWRRAAGRPVVEARSQYLLATSAFVVGIGELAFTRYTSPSDFENVFGHLFKVAAYLILYQAMVAARLRLPFEALRDSRAQLAEREQRLSAVLDNTLDGIVTLDAQGHVVVFNRAAEQLFGVRAAEALGSPLARFVPRADGRRFQVLARRQARRQARRWRLRGRRHDGSLFPLELSVSRSGEGAASLVTAVLRDLGPQAAVEASRRAQVAAEAASEAKSQFLAHMSHEIRTPLNAVLGFTDLALRGELSARQRQRLSRARIAGESLLGLIDQVLDLSKVEAGKLELAPAPFALDELVDRIDAVVGQLARSKGLAFRLERDPALPAWLHGDLHRLAQVLINLGGNAVKFTPQGAVTLALRQQAREAGFVALEISVQDTGIGLTEGELSRLFKPFSQADASTQRVHGGTGLGLAISQQLAGLMGGQITVQSTPGQGSRFSLTRRLGVAARPGAPAAASVRSGTAPPEALRGRKVLLVGDNPLNQQVATELLEQVAGLQVTVAADGPAALAALATDAPELVLLDLQLPGMDGFEVARRVRADARWARLPLIAMSAHAGERDRAACQAAGMNDHIGKPFEPGVLFQLLLRWLAPDALAVAAPPAGAAAREAAPAAPLDPALGLMYCGGRPALLARALATFEQCHAGTAERMEQALAAGHWPTLARLAHGLVAAAGNIGATPLSALAAQLQDAAAAADTQAAASLAGAVVRELGRVRQAVAAQQAAPP